jgi:hypothetical protein
MHSNGSHQDYHMHQTDVTSGCTRADSASDSTRNSGACTQHSAVPYLASLCVHRPSTAQLQCAALAFISATSSST